MIFFQRLLPILAAAMALAPGEADACEPDPCHELDVWGRLGPVNDVVPTDGVLVLAGVHGAAPIDPARIQLAVTLEGQPVAGALEVPDIFGVVVWRPAAPLTAGATYKVAGTVDNADEFDFCTADFDLAFDFTVGAGPSAPLEPPAVAAMTSVAVFGTIELGTLVCCDDTFPGMVVTDCGGGQVGWGPGQCASVAGIGLLAVTLTVASELPNATAALLSYRLLANGEPVTSRTLQPVLTWSSDAPLCTSVEVTNLATGATLTTMEECFGPGPGEQLGPQVLDPALAIDMCTGALQTCELDAEGDAWDPTRCTPWPAGEETGTPTTSDSDEAGASGSGDADTVGEESGEKGCACAARGASDPRGTLPLVGLGFALGRRRVRRP